MSLSTVSPGQAIRASHVNQFTRWITGLIDDVPFTPITTSSSVYTATLTNRDTTQALVQKWLYGASGSETTLATLNKTRFDLNTHMKIGAGSTLTLPQNGTSPGAPGAGFLSLYPTTTGNLAFIAGASATVNTVMVNPMTGVGQLIYGGASGAATVLAAGTTRQELVMDAGATGVTWASGVLAAAVTAGDVFYASGLGVVTRAAIGTARQSLQVNAGATGVTYAASMQSLAVTAGDVFAASAVNTVTRVAASAATTILHGGTAVAFSALAAGDFGAGIVTTAAIATGAVTQLFQVVGTTSTVTTASATYATLTEMTITATNLTVGSWIEADFNGTFFHATAAVIGTFALSLDGAAEVGARQINAPGSNYFYEASVGYAWQVTSTTHVITARWKVASGTLSSQGVERTLKVKEYKR